MAENSIGPAMSVENIDTLKVSSVLGRDVKSYGKQFLFDGEEDTCWNSDQGERQWVWLTLKRPERVAHLSVQFQGGFAAAELRLRWRPQDADDVAKFFPLDSNALQTFALPDEAADVATSSLHLSFDASTDTYGRIVVYKLGLHGPR